jgi:hypothetical protein
MSRWHSDKETCSGNNLLASSLSPSVKSSGLHISHAADFEYLDPANGENPPAYSFVVDSVRKNSSDLEGTEKFEEYLEAPNEGREYVQGLGHSVHC